jgi:hypothetical protein
MFYPIPTSSLLAQHDAWLAEARKEPSYPVADKSVRIRLPDAWLEDTRAQSSYPVAEPAHVRPHARLVSRIGMWLISIGLRLQARYSVPVRRVPKASSSPTPS